MTTVDRGHDALHRSGWSVGDARPPFLNLAVRPPRVSRYGRVPTPDHS
jgi:hypothetical protein